MSDDLNDLALYGLPCPFCGAQPGEWCRTARPYRLPPGRRTTWLHAARTDLLREAWRIGWDHGAAQTYGSIAQQIHGSLRGAFWARGVPTDPQALADWLLVRAEDLRGG